MSMSVGVVGAYVAWGGKLLEGHSIPPCYGSWHPTAVYVPIEVRAHSHLL